MLWRFASSVCSAHSDTWPAVSSTNLPSHRPALGAAAPFPRWRTGRIWVRRFGGDPREHFCPRLERVAPAVPAGREPASVPTVLVSGRQCRTHEVEVVRGGVHDPITSVENTARVRAAQPHVDHRVRVELEVTVVQHLRELSHFRRTISCHTTGVQPLSSSVACVRVVNFLRASSSVHPLSLSVFCVGPSSRFRQLWLTGRTMQRRFSSSPPDPKYALAVNSDAAAKIADV